MKRIKNIFVGIIIIFVLIIILRYARPQSTQSVSIKEGLGHQIEKNNKIEVRDSPSISIKKESEIQNLSEKYTDEDIPIYDPVNQTTGVKYLNESEYYRLGNTLVQEEYYYNNILLEDLTYRSVADMFNKIAENKNTSSYSQKTQELHFFKAGDVVKTVNLLDEAPVSIKGRTLLKPAPGHSYYYVPYHNFADIYSGTNDDRYVFGIDRTPLEVGLSIGVHVDGDLSVVNYNYYLYGEHRDNAKNQDYIGTYHRAYAYNTDGDRIKEITVFKRAEYDKEVTASIRNDSKYISYSIGSFFGAKDSAAGDWKSYLVKESEDKNLLDVLSANQDYHFLDLHNLFMLNSDYYPPSSLLLNRKHVASDAIERVLFNYETQKVTILKI